MSNITVENKDSKYYLKKNNKYISPWNDICLFQNYETYNFVCEIPKGTRAKMEMCKEVKYNPIVQDTEDGSPRVFKYKSIPFNYGFLPQTWEDPGKNCEVTGCFGDSDPVDVIELSSKSYKIGEVLPIKILGAIPIIDNNETDWKIIGIEHKYFFDIIHRDVKNTIFDWLNNYKTGINIIGDKIHSKDAALRVITTTYQHWKNKVYYEQNEKNSLRR